MSRKRSQIVQGILVSIVLTLVLGLVFALTKDTTTLLAVVGIYVSIVIALLFMAIEHLGSLSQFLSDIGWHPAVTGFIGEVLPLLKKSTGYGDPLFRRLLDEELREVGGQIGQLASGVIEFNAESWRAPWRELLEDKAVTFYHSTALVTSEAYWEDDASREAIEFNKRLAKYKPIERIFIVWDSVWTSQEIKDRIKAQKGENIRVHVVRKSKIPFSEVSQVLHDFGIYGKRAVGYQHLDDKCATIKFELHFDPEMYKKTQSRFERLKLYATEQATNEYLNENCP